MKYCCVWLKKINLLLFLSFNSITQWDALYQKKKCVNVWGNFSFTCYHCDRHMQNIDCHLIVFFFFYRSWCCICMWRQQIWAVWCWQPEPNHTYSYCSKWALFVCFCYLLCNIGDTVPDHEERMQYYRRQKICCFRIVMLNVDMSTSGWCWWCQFVRQKYRHQTDNHRMSVRW